MAINKQIKGSNLCETSCIEKKNVIHPETCVNQVLIDDSSEKTLREWILNAAEPATLGTYRCLKDWLLINYPVSGGSQDLPHADSTHYGVIKTGEDNPYLTLNDGVLTFNYSQLPQLLNATFTTLGGVKLGNNGTVSGTFTHVEDYSDITYPTGLFSNFYGFPLSLDKNNRAGVVIPQELFSGRVQSDWNTSDNTDSSYIRNKPSLAAVATSGNYNELINKPTIPAAQIQSDWNQTNTTALDYIKNKPTIPTAIQSDWNQTDSAEIDYIKNKPILGDFNLHADNTISDYIASKLTYAVAERQGDSHNLYIIDSPIRIDVTDVVLNGTIFQDLFRIINAALEHMYENINYSYYCELIINFALAPDFRQVVALSVFDENVNCVDTTQSSDSFNYIDYSRDGETGKCYLRFSLDNSESNNMRYTLNIIISRTYDRSRYKWEIKLNRVSTPYKLIQFNS